MVVVKLFLDKKPMRCIKLMGFFIFAAYIQGDGRNIKFNEVFY